MQADMCTPVSALLKMRDRCNGVLLLEGNERIASGGSHFSFLAASRLAEIKIQNGSVYYQQDGEAPVVLDVEKIGSVQDLLNVFRMSFPEPEFSQPVPAGAAGLYGYAGFEAAALFDEANVCISSDSIPELRYAAYRFVLVFDHLQHTLSLIEIRQKNEPSRAAEIEQLLQQQDVPRFRFTTEGSELADMSESRYLECVEKAQEHCKRGDVFQLVLSRRFSQAFSGDEFNVYRALRAINPSPFLFYADFGNYRLFGSSPEAQLMIKDNRAVVHPIAGTCKRTGDAVADKAAEEKLLADAKETAEHVMLVDLARNDLSRSLKNVKVDVFRNVQQFSHVQHLVSEVSGELTPQLNPFQLLADTFPAGTLTGAPKVKAMQLIAKYEASPRSWYGGCIGQAGFDVTFRQAILIRSFLSYRQQLEYRAGAGVVEASQPAAELDEINRKLQALRLAMVQASTLNN
ncbi:MAG: anthranilate synthase component I family protein [Bacteroidetes bacterium]|nr:anthranilate synthase component I family protein [Bacteroidota bacterium]